MHRYKAVRALLESRLDMRLARNGTCGRPLWVTVVLLAVGWLISADGDAQDVPSEAELSWVRAPGAESCADARSVREQVDRRLGRHVFGTRGAIAFEAEVSRAGSRWFARITARGSSGELLGARALESEALRCDSLVEAAGLAIALVIDPNAGDRVAQPPPPEPPDHRPARLATPPPLRSAARTRHVDAPAWVDVRALLSAGLLPGLAPGVALGAELPMHSRLSASTELRYWPEQATRALDSRFAFGLTALALGLCLETLRGRALGLALCAAGQLGAIHAVVFDLPPTEPGQRFWAAASAKAQLYLPLGPTRISIALLGAAPITRHHFRAIGQDETIFRQSAVVAAGELGLGMRFP
jgi:hypothetical protein